MEVVLKQKLILVFVKSEFWVVDWEKELLFMLVICVRLYFFYILFLKFEVYQIENRYVDIKYKRLVIFRWFEI